MLNNSQLNRARLNQRAYLRRPVAGAAAAAVAGTLAAPLPQVLRAAQAGSPSTGTFAAVSQRAAAARGAASVQTGAVGEGVVYRGGQAGVSAGATILAFAPHLVFLQAGFTANAWGLAVAKGKLAYANAVAGATMPLPVADRVIFAFALGASAAGMVGESGAVLNFATANIVAGSQVLGTGHRNNWVDATGWFAPSSVASAAAGRQTLVSRPLSASAAMTATANRVYSGAGVGMVGQAQLEADAENVTFVESTPETAASMVAQPSVYRMASAAAVGAAQTLAVGTGRVTGVAAAVAHSDGNGLAVAVRGGAASGVTASTAAVQDFGVRRGGFATCAGGVVMAVSPDLIASLVGDFTATSQTTAGGTRTRTLPPAATATEAVSLRADATRVRLVVGGVVGEASITAYPSRVRLGYATVAATASGTGFSLTNPAVRAPSMRVVTVTADPRQMALTASPRLMEVA